MEIIQVFEDPLLCARRNNELNDYRINELFTDLELKATDDMTMKVHKNILSASCSYFKGILKLKSNWDIRTLQLEDDVKYADLQILVEYFYTGLVKVSLGNAENLFIKAHCFQLNELKEFCSKILIKNIKIENCLDYWRISVKYLNSNLKDECLKFIKSNCKKFLNRKVLSLTAEEFKLLMSDKKVLSIKHEDLYKFVARWVQSDFWPRNVNLMELIRNLDFNNISVDFIEHEIINDETLNQNQEFNRYISNILIEKLQKQYNPKSDILVKLKSFDTENCLKSIYLITNGGIYKLNFNESSWVNKFKFQNERRAFATAAFNDEIFISGGVGNLQNQSYTFEKWNSSTCQITELQQMGESRYEHKLINFKGKIYCCGGSENDGSTEIFENFKWTKGKSMNEAKSSFTLINTDDSLYAFGGLFSNVVEQFDPYEDKWRIISMNTPQHTHSAILHNNSVYCFTSIFGGKIFNLETKEWSGSLAPVCRKKSGVNYLVGCCDIVTFNDSIFGVFQTDKNTWGTYKFDHNANKWTDLNIPLSLNEEDNINLCIVSENL